MKIVICGLAITSSWGNGHATTYRGLVRELSRLGHDVLFLEREQPWYSENRDLVSLPQGTLGLYSSLSELKDCFGTEIRTADAVIVGSYVPEGRELGYWITNEARGVTAFYDIDTPVTVSCVLNEGCEYINRELINAYDLYLSFSGGPVLKMIEDLGSPKVRPLYCSVDTDFYFPDQHPCRWELGYLGTYSADRHRMLRTLLINPATVLPKRQFVVAGPQYPTSFGWGKNIERIDHVPPTAHREFFSSMRFTLNVTRRNMAAVGFSPSVRLFEAAACGTPIISDYWDGLEDFFKIGSEILVANNSDEALQYLTDFSDHRRAEMSRRAHERVTRLHSAKSRAAELEAYLEEVA